jgi:hypothetical protein
MPISAADLRGALTGKFGFKEREGSRHPKYRLEVGGLYVAHTQMSRSWRDIDDSMTSTIARQLGVSRAELTRMVDCRISREQYLERFALP